MLAPVIVLGLGGIGSEVVARLEKKVNEKKLSGKILFATIDTDINTINKIEQMGFGGCVVQISKSMTVKEYLNTNKEKYEEWFQTTEGLNIKSMTEGAGQVRAISRLAFDMAVRNGYLNELEEKISHLFQISENEMHQTPRILIISSLAGGTGSGIVLPLALYMRRYFEEMLHSASVIVKGMFILPDVFHDIVGSTYERVSMEANAYAALKELEAFIKKGEGYLAPSYSDKLHIELPNSASGKWEEYVTLPYSYCYLFGGKNSRGHGLRSFQDYLEYTVECIYAQAFSPMQELNNSIEDNVFRIASTGLGANNKDGFKRFCSSGTAVLNYPYEKIVELLALRKATKILAEQWASIDQEYFFDCKKKEEILRKGKYVSTSNKRDFYLEYVNTHKMESTFIKKVYIDTMVERVLESGEVIYSESWKKYWEALEKEVDRWVSDYQAIKKYYDNVQAMLKFVEDHPYHRTREEFTKIRDFYKILLREAKKELEKKKGFVEFKFFGNRTDDTIEESYFLYWLKKDGKFIHPNAIRFFLYSAIDMFEKKQEELKERVKEEDAFLNSMQEDASKKVDFFQKPFLNNLFRKSEMDKIVEKTNEGIQAIKAYQCDVLLAEIAQKGSEMFQKLARQYEELYGVFEYNTKQYTERAENLKHSIQEVSGTITRYVCCNDKCLEYLETATVDVRNDVEVNGEISEIIFNLIRDNLNKRTNNISDYHDIFQEQLVDYWKKELKEKYNHVLDMDIIEALEREGICVSKNCKRTDSYVAVKINKMWDIAGPFVSIREGNTELFKDFCTYSALLEERKDYMRDGIIKILKNKGGTADTEGAIDKYTIVFYQVLYALAPNSLKEMAIEWDKDKQEFQMGNISKGYYQMLSHAKDTRMTPHIDWNWNRIDVLPDFNAEYQHYLEKLTYQMFLYECVQSMELMIVDNVKKYNISLKNERKQASTLYEILVEYFLTDYSQIYETYDSMRKNIEQCIYEGKDWRKQEFIGSFEMWCSTMGGIFGVIYCVNVDGGINKYDKSRMRTMVHAFLELLWYIFIQFENENRVKEHMQEIVYTQYTKYEDTYIQSDVFVKQDMKYAIYNKLKDMDILANWLTEI